jgi:hypothetical protein
MAVVVVSHAVHGLQRRQVARDNQAQYVETDPFKTLVKDGELRQQGKEQWRLSEFLDYRGAHRLATAC